MTTSSGNFQNWLNSPQGWIFYVYLLIFVLTILVNLIAFFWHQRWKRIGRGGILAVLGGFITFAGPPVFVYDIYSGGLQGLGRPLNFVGLLWLLCFAIPKRISAILGLFLGSLAIAVSTRLEVLAAQGVPIDATREGAYVSLVGSLVLIVGSVLAFLEAKEPAAPRFGPVARVPPPLPIRSDFLSSQTTRR